MYEMKRTVSISNMKRKRKRRRASISNKGVARVMGKVEMPGQ